MDEELNTAKKLLPFEKGGPKNSPFKFEPRCTICSTSEEILTLINSMLLQGRGYADISRTLQPLFKAVGAKPLTDYMVKVHHNRHFNFKNEAIRKIHLRKQESQISMGQDGAEAIIDAVLTAEVIMTKGLQQATEEGAPVTVAETLAAAKLHHELTKDVDGQTQLASANAQLHRIISAVKQVCSVEQITRIIAILDTQDYVEVESSSNSKEDEDLAVSIVGEDD